ncbi:MAG: hypothetical protein JW717_12035, partial [Marinilabiliaceae bacterium]|nr:hypothetical protein [Marinilabiliaceae bacterium]
KDQVTAFPPNRPILSPIWKWTKTPRVIMGEYIDTKSEDISRKFNFKNSVKKQIKTYIANLMFLKLITHQIIVAKNV